MKQFNIETDNIITGKKENFNSEKVCLDHSGKPGRSEDRLI